MGKLCISTVVNKIYQKYIPIFLYFCLKSYPDYGIKLFLTEKIDEKYRGVINKLRGLGTIELVENYGKEFPKNTHHELKIIRWLLEANDFGMYDYVYVGDVDIIICKEDKPLLDQHLEHCAVTGLPYSNSVRPNSRRLSGLHFMKKSEYYIEMDVIIQKYRKMLMTGRLGNTKNEEVLYRMVEESSLKFSEEWFRPHHGLHLGIWRKKADQSLDEFLIYNEEYKYGEYYKFYKYLKEDSLFKEIYSVNKLTELSNMEDYFENKRRI